MLRQQQQQQLLLLLLLCRLAAASPRHCFLSLLLRSRTGPVGPSLLARQPRRTARRRPACRESFSQNASRWDPPCGGHVCASSCVRWFGGAAPTTPSQQSTLHDSIYAQADARHVVPAVRDARQVRTLCCGSHTLSLARRRRPQRRPRTSFGTASTRGRPDSAPAAAALSCRGQACCHALVVQVSLAATSATTRSGSQPATTTTEHCESRPHLRSCRRIVTVGVLWVQPMQPGWDLCIESIAR